MDKREGRGRRLKRNRDGSDISLNYLPFLTRWVLDCGGVLREHRDSWSHLIPTEPEERAILAEHYFNTVCSLMARQLRDCVKASIDEFISFLKIYQVMYKTTCNYSNFWVTYMHYTCTVFCTNFACF